jgi:hypothetical protein
MRRAEACRRLRARGAEMTSLKALPPVLKDAALAERNRVIDISNATKQKILCEANDKTSMALVAWQQHWQV